MKIRDWFSSISRKAAEISGSWQASIFSIAVVVVWAATGPMFGFSDTWQLICNTGTTIVTFVMVFLIQGASNRDQRAVQLKLDDLLCSIKKADDKLINIEDATDDEIKKAKENIKPHSGSDR
jgi:low affinity Fe/Cu permease